MLDDQLDKWSTPLQPNVKPPSERFDSYLSSKLTIRCLSRGIGMGLFAQEFVPAGELLCIFSGVLISALELTQLPVERKQKSLQIEENYYLMSVRLDEPADYMNHACNPNAGLDGQILVRAMRDIHVDEEVCYDYAMSDGSPYDEFDCACGAVNCRKRITGQDWQRPDLQLRYSGWFSPYLQRRIDQQRQNR